MAVNVFFCDLSSLCPPDTHKKHIQTGDQECIVQRKSQCQDHWIDHPDNFAVNEDIVVEKTLLPRPAGLCHPQVE
jgi:hypothetical protein